MTHSFVPKASRWVAISAVGALAYGCGGVPADDDPSADQAEALASQGPGGPSATGGGRGGGGSHGGGTPSSGGGTRGGGGGGGHGPVGGIPGGGFGRGGGAGGGAIGAGRGGSPGGGAPGAVGIPGGAQGGMRGGGIGNPIGGRDHGGLPGGGVGIPGGRDHGGLPGGGVGIPGGRDHGGLPGGGVGIPGGRDHGGLPGGGDHRGDRGDRGRDHDRPGGDHGWPGRGDHGWPGGGDHGRPGGDHGWPGGGDHGWPGGGDHGRPGGDHGWPGGGDHVGGGWHGHPGAGWPGGRWHGGDRGWWGGDRGWHGHGQRFVPFRHGYARGWYGYANRPLVFGSYTIQPVAWGWTGGNVWYGVDTPVVLSVPQVVTIVVGVNQAELALAQEVLGRGGFCGAEFAQQVVEAHSTFSRRLESYTSDGFTQSSSRQYEQIETSSRAAVEQFAGLSGAELGRAYVYNERTRAEQMIDLIDNQLASAIGDADQIVVLENLRAMYSERIEAADEVAQQCGYAPVGIGG